MVPRDFPLGTAFRLSLYRVFLVSVPKFPTRFLTLPFARYSSSVFSFRHIRGNCSHGYNPNSVRRIVTPPGLKTSDTSGWPNGREPSANGLMDHVRCIATLHVRSKSGKRRNCRQLQPGPFMTTATCVVMNCAYTRQPKRSAEKAEKRRK